MACLEAPLDLGSEMSGVAEWGALSGKSEQLRYAHHQMPTGQEFEEQKRMRLITCGEL